MAETAHQAMVSVMLNADARFIFPDGDWYWSKHLLKRGYYEPEIDTVLRRAADRPYALIDAGANFGYWSVLASSTPYGRHPAIAIEASRGNFYCLVANAAANANRFETLHRAILDVSGKRANLFGKKHFGMSLRQEWHPDDVSQCEEVETITLDAVAHGRFADRTCPPILKIDVEGVEIEAMQGGRRLIDEGALMIFEDHGKEASHRISRFVLSLADIAVWFLERDEQLTQVTTLDQVQAIKQKPTKGYNFFACRRSSPWSSLFKD